MFLRMVGEYGPGSFTYLMARGLTFTNHSQEHSLSISPKVCELESNTVFNWLNCLVVLL